MHAVLKTACLAAIAGIICAAPVAAHPGGGQGGPPASVPDAAQPDRDHRLREHDRDRDGRIDQAELGAWHEQGLAMMDADNSGGFTLQEFLQTRLGPGPRSGVSASRRQRMEERAQLRKTERFRLMDGNGDGIVSRNEYMNFGELNYLYPVISTVPTPHQHAPAAEGR